MSGHPPPHIKPKGSIGRLKNAFLYGTPLSGAFASSLPGTKVLIELL
jgi:hypothetical protein